MIEPSWFLLGAALPALLCAVVVFSATKWLMPRTDIGGRLGWAVGVAIALLAGEFVTGGLPPFPPVESHDWLIWAIVPVVCVIAALAALPGVPRQLVWCLRLAVAAATPAILLQSYIQYTWSWAQGLVWLSGLSLGVVALWVWLHLLIRRHSEAAGAWWWPAVAVMLAAGTGAVILFSGSLTLGKIGLALAAIWAGGLAASLFIRRNASSCIDPGLVVVPLLGLCMNGIFYASMGPADALLLSGAALSCWIGELPWLRKLGPNRGAVLRVVLVAVVVAIPVFRAGLAFMRDFNEPSYY